MFVDPKKRLRRRQLILGTCPTMLSIFYKIQSATKLIQLKTTSFNTDNEGTYLFKEYSSLLRTN